jgi:hypothetical protein
MRSLPLKVFSSSMGGDLLENWSPLYTTRMVEKIMLCGGHDEIGDAG